MNNILSIVTELNGKSVGAGQVILLCLIGFALVVATLIILIFLLILFSKIFGKIDSMSLGKKSAKVAEVSAQPTVGDEDEETVAAITAALIAFYDAGRSDGEEEIAPPFVIRSIKKN